MINKVSLPGDGFELEGMCHLPLGEGAFPGVVVCHPDPLFGGNMDNNVVFALCQALARKSIIALRFNFRSVGKGIKGVSRGAEEWQDAKTALSFLATKADKERLGLAGYSFGAMVAIFTAEQSEIKALALISPPLFPPGLLPLKEFAHPKLIVSGSDDLFILPSLLQTQAQELPLPTEVQLIPGADHFWLGHEETMAESVAHFFARNL